MVYNEKIAREHMERMKEPEHLKKLRRQLDQLDAEERERLYEIQAEQLRQQIKARGAVPVA